MAEVNTRLKPYDGEMRISPHTIRRCRFCNNTPTLFVDSVKDERLRGASMREETVYTLAQMICRGCGAAGPIADREHDVAHKIGTYTMRNPVFLMNAVSFWNHI